MDLRAELFKNKKKLWLVFTPEPEALRFSPLIELIDWYNNQQLAKSFKNKKIKLKVGEKTLFSALPLMPCQNLVVWGLTDLEKNQGADIFKSIDETLKGFAENSPWFAISKNSPETFIHALQKKYDSVVVG